MNLRRTLSALARAVADEADRNPQFAKQIWIALGNGCSATDAQKGTSRTTSGTEPKRQAHRRASPTVDPVSLARQGESALRNELEKLTLTQLLDVVAGYGMDTGKLVMKWKTPERVIERIVEVSMSRAQKGSAFRLTESDGHD